jgi:hypothetical protein
MGLKAPPQVRGNCFFAEAAKTTARPQGGRGGRVAEDWYPPYPHQHTYATSTCPTL